MVASKKTTEELLEARQAALHPNLVPRGLSRTAAAAYIGISPSLFDQMVYKGVFPKALRFGGRLVWDRHAIDRAFDQMSSDAADAHPANEWDRLT